MSASQESPQAGQQLEGFPETTVQAHETMYRAHSSGRGAWWFDNGNGGRFNLRGERGTCYTATTIDTAVRERVRGRVSKSGIVSPTLADSFVVSGLTATVPFRCAAVSQADAARYGIVRELVTVHEYDIPQQWAAEFDAAGFDGIFYGSAYTTGEASAYALFGPAGAADGDAGYQQSLALNGDEACQALGWVVPRPSSRGMHISP